MWAHGKTGPSAAQEGSSPHWPRWGRPRQKMYFSHCHMRRCTHRSSKVNRGDQWAVLLRHLPVTPAKFHLDALRSEAASKASEKGCVSEISFYSLCYKYCSQHPLFFKKFTFSLWTHCNKPGLEYSQQVKTIGWKYDIMRSHPALDFDRLFWSTFP